MPDLKAPDLTKAKPQKPDVQVPNSTLPALSLHHIGVVCRDMAKDLLVFEQLGYVRDSEIFVETGQKVKGLFISAPNQPRLELLENLESSGPLDSCLQKGIKFYHFAYEVRDIEAELEKILSIGQAKVIVPICEAVFFKKICFVMLPNMMLIELVQLN